MKLWKIGLTLIVIALVVVGGYVLVILSRPASAHPGAAETFVANLARYLGMPGSYRRLPDPLQPTPANIQAGMAHFADHCSICHGNDGRGDTLFGRGLYPKPPDLRGPGAQHKTDGELYYIIENGVPLTGMPAFSEHPGATDNLETWHLVIFIRHLPSLTDAELLTMSELNPKTEGDRREEKEEQEFLNGGEPSKAPAGKSEKKK